MEQRRAVFGIVHSIEEMSTTTKELTDANRSAKTVNFETGETVRIVAGGDMRLDRYRSILQSASEARIPVYVVVEDATNTIVDLRIPLPADIVTSISEIDYETLEVQLQLSQARHFLKRSSPDFRRLHDALEKIHKSRIGAIITENDNSEIVDVREAPLPFAFEEAPPRGLEALRAVTAISMGEAQGIFSMVSGRTCDPISAPAPCIPFLYPYDGCYARAHEMCRLIDADKTGKVWIYGTLLVKTRNYPSCSVSWRYHVAPTVEVSTGSGRISYVLDPSLFTKPVTIERWKSVQGDPGARIVPTDAEPYFRRYDGAIIKAPNDKEFTKVLESFRFALRRLSASPAGAPPYAHCPPSFGEIPVTLPWLSLLLGPPVSRANPRDVRAVALIYLSSMNLQLVQLDITA